MKAFLSHSSLNKSLVVQIHEELTPDSAWLDRAEIEWGDLFLERISSAIEDATDFVLFWSRDAAKSEWVRLELNMAFVRMLRERAIRLRVIILDHTSLPLYLKPFHFIDASDVKNPKELILQRLKAALQQPVEAQRHRFLNRHSELERIEIAIDNPTTCLIVLTGVHGIGKRSLADEALRRFFEGSDHIAIDVTAGTDLTELALKLNAHGRNTGLESNLPKEQLRTELALSLESVARSGRLLTISNIQHWLDDEASPEPPLTDFFEIVNSVPGFRDRPVVLTSTRRLATETSRADYITAIWVEGLPTEHVGTLLRHWYRIIQGEELSHNDADIVASQLHGHPIAAKLAADLVGQHGADYLDKYPAAVIKLRRDLARHLLTDIPLSEGAEVLLVALSMIGVPVSASIICDALDLTDDEFQAAVDQASRAGILNPGLAMQVHPLFLDYFWRRYWQREDYKPVASALAESVWKHAQKHLVGTVEFADLLPVAVRSFALAGEFERATSIRSDLRGELLSAAMAHYHRRNYDLAETYIDHVLQDDPNEWKARLYKARILIRRQRWNEANKLLNQMLTERPGDKTVRHAKGWSLLRARDFENALNIFLDVLTHSDHVRSLRDAAHCLHELNRSEEALQFLERAQTIESDNPFTVDLRARILEDRNQLPEAFEALSIAVARDPANWSFHHRLGRILVKQRRPREAVPHFRRAHELAPEQFTPASSLMAALLDSGAERDEIQEQLDTVEKACRTPADHEVTKNLRARVLKLDGEYEEAVELLEAEIKKQRNLLPNLGLLAEVRLAQYERDRMDYPASARVFRDQARRMLEQGLEIAPDSEILLSLLEKLPEE